MRYSEISCQTFIDQVERLVPDSNWTKCVILNFGMLDPERILTWRNIATICAIERILDLGHNLPLDNLLTIWQPVIQRVGNLLAGGQRFQSQDYSFVLADFIWAKSSHGRGGWQHVQSLDFVRYLNPNHRAVEIVVHLDVFCWNIVTAIQPHRDANDTTRTRMGQAEPVPRSPADIR